MISSAYRLAASILEAELTIFQRKDGPFHFSVMETIGLVDDTRACIQIPKEQLIPVSNQFSYGQVESPYGSGQFIRDLNENFVGSDDCSLV